MKHFNDKHEAFIHTDMRDILEAGKKYQDGDLISKKEVATTISFYAPNHENEFYKKVFVSKEFIFDLYNQIMKIEEIDHEGKYDSLPF